MARHSKNRDGARSLCVVTHSRYPNDPRVKRETQAACDAGYEVKVVCLRDVDEAAREIVDGADVIRLPVRHRRGIGMAGMLWEYSVFTLLATLTVARLLCYQRIDIVHIHTPPDFLICAGLLPRLFGSRVILDIHDLSTHLYEARLQEKGPRWLIPLAVAVLALIQRLACGAAHSVITVHEPYKRELAQTGVRSEAVTVVMNSTDDSVMAAARRSRAVEAPVTTDDFVVSYHGTITPWYGVDLIVEALARLHKDIPNIRAIVIGDGDALEPAQARASDLGVSDRIWFSSRYLPLAEVLTRVAEADCGVIPNRASTLNRFALSSKLFDYVALGVPVVVSRLETLAAHFSEDEATFFEPDNAESLTAAIRWVALNRDEASRKAQLASARYSADYSWPANRTRLLVALDSDL